MTTMVSVNQVNQDAIITRFSRVASLAAGLVKRGQWLLSHSPSECQKRSHRLPGVYYMSVSGKSTRLIYGLFFRNLQSGMFILFDPCHSTLRMDLQSREARNNDTLQHDN